MVAVHRLLLAVTFLAVEHWLQAQGLWQFWFPEPRAEHGSVWAQYGLSHSTACELIAGPRIKPVSPALAGGFCTTEPPGNSPISFWNNANNYPVLSVTPLTSFHSVCPCTCGVRRAPLSSLKFRKVK